MASVNASLFVSWNQFQWWTININGQGFDRANLRKGLSLEDEKKEVVKIKKVKDFWCQNWAFIQTLQFCILERKKVDSVEWSDSDVKFDTMHKLRVMICTLIAIFSTAINILIQSCYSSYVIQLNLLLRNIRHWNCLKHFPRFGDHSKLSPAFSCWLGIDGSVSRILRNTKQPEISPL